MRFFDGGQKATTPAPRCLCGEQTENKAVRSHGQKWREPGLNVHSQNRDSGLCLSRTAAQQTRSTVWFVLLASTHMVSLAFYPRSSVLQSGIRGWELPSVQLHKRSQLNSGPAFLSNKEPMVGLLTSALVGKTAGAWKVIKPNGAATAPPHTRPAHTWRP